MPRNVDFERICRSFSWVISSVAQSVHVGAIFWQFDTSVAFRVSELNAELTAMQDTFLLCLLHLSPRRSATFKQNREEKKKRFRNDELNPKFSVTIAENLSQIKTVWAPHWKPPPPVVLADPMWRTCSSWKFNFLLSDYFYPGTGALTLLAFRFSALLGWAQRACLGLIRESLSDTRRDPEHELAQYVSPQPLKQQIRNHSAPAHSFIVTPFCFFHCLFLFFFVF